MRSAKWQPSDDAKTTRAFLFVAYFAFFTVKHLVMALTEGVQYLQDAEGGEEAYPGKYSRRKTRPDWKTPTRLTVKVDDIVDDSIVAELEKERFIDKLYKH